MSQLITKIEPKEIEQLGPDDLVRLLHRLLHCEARHFGLQKTGILVPFQINVPDGGRDGRWNANIGQHEFIPRPLTFYQCKADHITEAMCRDEVAPEKKTKKSKDSVFVVKERVREVLTAGGCFAFFCSKHEVKPSEGQDLITIAHEQLSKAGFTPTQGSCVDFFGCNRIADWVNKFPAAVRFVREATKGFGGLHFYTIEGWSKLGSISGEFFDNLAITQKIASIRESLMDGKTRVVRLTGLSGVGKSRLAYEALKASNVSDVMHRALSASSIYMSYEDKVSDLLSFVSHLADNGYSATVVIDDCPPSIHDKIVNITTNSSLSILTIFHEPQQQRSDSHPLSLTPDDMGDVVERILRADSHLVAKGEDAIKGVAAFAQGFPQIAKLITEFRRAPTIDELRDRAGLFQKLLSEKGDTPDQITLLTIQSLSMFRTIGGSAIKLEDDLSTIRELFCPQIDELDYRRSLEQQKGRRVVQEIADTLMVVPRPLGVALAADLIQAYPPGRWKETVERLQHSGLLESFARRIEELEFSDKGEQIGKLLLESGLPFDDAEYLLTGTTGSRIFRVLSLLNPSAAIKIAKRIIEACPIDKLRAAKESRRDLVVALEFLTWEEQTFFDAASLLLRLAAAENEGWANNATGAFSQLFNLYLSGTKVPAQERLRVIRDALAAPESAIRLAAVGALKSGLNFGHFSRPSDTTLAGKREPQQDWRPATRREELDYWKGCYSILHDIIIQSRAESLRAREILGQNLDPILRTRLIVELDADFQKLSTHIGRVWPEVKDQIKRILEMSIDLSPSHREALERWKSYLTPAADALEDRLRDVVSSPGWHYRKAPDKTYSNTSQEEAERLASEFADQNTDLVPYLQQILTGEQQQAFTFGVTLARRHPRVKDIVEAALTLWPTLDPKNRNAALLSGIMRGFGHASEQRTKTLQCVFDDKELIDLLVPLTVSVDAIDESDFNRIRQAIEEARLEPGMLRHLVSGQPLSGLPDDFVARQLHDILSMKPEAAHVIFEVLWMHCHSEPQKFDRFASLFRVLLLKKELPILDRHFGWEWQEAARLLIRGTIDKDWLNKLAQHVCSTLLENKTWVGTDFLSSVAGELFERAPRESWEVFGDALRDGDQFQRFVLAEFLGSSESSFEDTTSPLWKFPLEQFRQWIRGNREFIPLILGRMSLYTVQKVEEGVEIFKWHPHALTLIEEGRDEDEKELECALSANLFTFGSTGSRVPYLEKRLLLLRDLDLENSPRMKRIARTVGGWISEEIERTRREELNEQAKFK